MPTIKEEQRKARQKPLSEKQPVAINLQTKYVSPNSILFGRDAGICGDEVSDGYIVFRAFGTEFIVKQTMLENPNIMRDTKVRECLKHIADTHANRTMYICINTKGEVCICDAATARFHKQEKFCIDGTKIVAEKGVYDGQNSKDVKWLLSLVERFKKQRVMLVSENDIPIDVNIRNGNEAFVGHHPE